MTPVELASSSFNLVTNLDGPGVNRAVALVVLHVGQPRGGAIASLAGGLPPPELVERPPGEG